MEIKYGNDNEENGNGAPVLTVVELPHAAKQTNRLPFFNFIPGPESKMDKNLRRLLASPIVLNLSKRINVS